MPLAFVFTPDSFRVDETAVLLSEEDTALQQEFLKNRYKALFRIGFEENKSGSMSFRFLQRLSVAFLDALCALPELEIAREHAEVVLAPETAQELLRSVPYVIGSEHITEDWLTEMFRRLTAVYAYEITEYDGSVAMFLCTCPDWALMCKHVAAAMYGVGVRLDENPFYYFSLRGLDVDRFIDVTLENRVELMLENAGVRMSRVMEDADTFALFGL